jgi:hypothetical protein
MNQYLKYAVPELLKGHWTQLCLWMKTAFWKPGETTATAEQVLLSCFRFLPKESLWPHWSKELLDNEAELVLPLEMVL